MPGAMRERARGTTTGGRRGVRLPEVALGLVLVAGAALAAVVWQATGEPTRSVVVLAHDVERGRVLAAGDLRVERVRLPGTVPAVDAADGRSVVGKVAAADLRAGTLVSPSVVSDRPTAGADERVVGIALSPGDAPVRLRRGDRVDLVRTPAGSATTAAPAPEVLVAGAVVADVDRPDEPSRPVQLGLIVPERSAPAVAAAVAAKQLRLVGVGAGTGS